MDSNYPPLLDGDRVYLFDVFPFEFDVSLPFTISEKPFTQLILRHPYENDSGLSESEKKAYSFLLPQVLLEGVGVSNATFLVRYNPDEKR